MAKALTKAKRSVKRKGFTHLNDNSNHDTISTSNSTNDNNIRNINSSTTTAVNDNNDSPCNVDKLQMCLEYDWDQFRCTYSSN